MLRGRHRGLPSAIDRAIVLPYDLGLDDEEASFGPRQEMQRVDPGAESGQKEKAQVEN